VIGLVTARRQRRRLRITPNTNTRTTTMISTHNHVDMTASLVGAGAGQADTTAAHPGEQLPASRRPPWPGSTAALRAGARGVPAPRDLPADLGCGRVPARPARRPRAGPGGPSPSCHAQPAPAQPYRPAPQKRRTQQAATDPTRPQRGRPARGMARPRRVCPAWVGEQSKHGCAETQWQTPRRRRRTDGARLRRNPHLRRGRLHRPAFPVQPRSVLRDPPRVGRAGGDSAAATPPLSCRGPMVSSTRSPRLTARIRQQGHGRG
jgi:hypothetical protein